MASSLNTSSIIVSSSSSSQPAAPAETVEWSSVTSGTTYDSRPPARSIALPPHTPTKGGFRTPQVPPPAPWPLVPQAHHIATPRTPRSTPRRGDRHRSPRGDRAEVAELLRRLELSEQQAAHMAQRSAYQMQSAHVEQHAAVAELRRRLLFGRRSGNTHRPGCHG